MRVSENCMMKIGNSVWKERMNRSLEPQKVKMRRTV
jgi:hypothetical protein